jgi:hypothetical protein
VRAPIAAVFAPSANVPSFVKVPIPVSAPVTVNVAPALFRTSPLIWFEAVTVLLLVTLPFTMPVVAKVALFVTGLVRLPAAPMVSVPPVTIV